MTTFSHSLETDWDDDTDLPEIVGGITFHHSLHDLPSAVLKVRAFQAFPKQAMTYPVHRTLRCAVRRQLEELFDDLALSLGLVAQRLGVGALLLDGPGVLVKAQGTRKMDYSSCTFEIWAVNKARAEQMRAALLHVIGEQRIQQCTFTLDWHFASAGSELHSSSFEEIADDVLHDAAYPMLGGSVNSFIERYLDAKEAVLVLQGPPGTGKTRLVRAVLAAISKRKAENACVMYTADKKVIESDRIFLEFLTGSHDAFVIEDADHMLMARSNGNQDLHRFLATSDGLVRAQGRKIIFTSNLPNVGDLDDALVRPGRCFANVRVRLLDRAEAERLINKLSAQPEIRERTLRAALPEGVKWVSLAEIYRAVEE